MTSATTGNSAGPSEASVEGTRRVRVALANRSYDVLIGPRLLSQAETLLAQRLGPARVAIVTDENVAGHYLPALERGFAAVGKHLGTVVLPPGEGTKCFAELARLTERLLELKLERGDAVIALGGGVIGDLAGFAAAIIRRGVRFVQIPTTLLAQVDSSVGGKTGINTPQGKNLVGAFHQPSLVLADTDTLSTLPARELRAGYAEVVKYGLLGDAGFFAWLERRAGAVLGNDVEALTEAVEKSVSAKARIVERDETEAGDRMLLNLGHTFGHALEAWAGYSSRLLHGEAIAIGMAQAARFSERQGLLAAGQAARIERHLHSVGLPTRIADIPGSDRPSADRLLALMAQDKKVQRGRLTLILLRAIGEAFVARDADEGEVRRFLLAEAALPYAG